MGDKTGISWTDATWNPTTGCTHLSAGCDNCYADRMANRLQKMGVKKYEKGLDLMLHPEVLDQPLRWQRPRMIFVDSMSDLFHSDVPSDFIFQVFEAMKKAHWHTYQILTKRPGRAVSWLRDMWLAAGKPVLPNVWLGTSVEGSRVKWCIDELRKMPAAVRFLSIEPLIGPVGRLDLTCIYWVIAGGESGPNFRLLNLDWAREVRDQCVAQDVPFYFKQVGGITPGSGGHLLDGRQWKQFPAPVAKNEAKKRAA